MYTYDTFAYMHLELRGSKVGTRPRLLNLRRTEKDIGQAVTRHLLTFT